ncbi:MAG: UDP-N-acetylglucosamine 1-carboxyvinyltransferase [Clostridia bacterium]|nr:UDP-N-acetylglucosamine 1-carboxyvinyltransferase [Clostridia bacterium]
MDKIFINGGNHLKGEVTISGAKNAIVGILPATILAQDVCVIENVPNISDVSMMLRILHQLGARVRHIDETTVEIDSSTINSYVVTHDMTKHLRASYYFIGALLARFGRAKVAMPGGCNFGVRPIDQHIKGFEILGSEVNLKENAMIDADSNGLSGGLIYLDVVSVGATMNLMLAAVKAKGLTVIENAAKEPHIVDLANFLNSMGADVRGAGTDVIKIRGVDKLHGCTYSTIPDQIEAGTFMVAAAATKGEVLIKNVIPKHLESITTKLIQCGVEVEEYDDSLLIRGTDRPKKCNVKTMPHPGFPTDMQPQFTTLLAVAEGTSIVSEGVWDNRFQYVEQLARMGANISVNGKAATVEGVECLNGSPVKADDLRAGAAMLIAGLIAKGTTEIENIVYIDRGYDNVVGKLQALGADIHRVTDDDTPKVVESVS